MPLTAGASAPPATRASIQSPSPPAHEEYEVLGFEPGAYVFGAWKNILITVWRSHATGPAVDRLEYATATLAARRPGRRSNVHLIVTGAGLPTPEARARLRQLASGNASLACVGVVIGRAGFWTSAVQSAVSGMMLLLPRSFDLRILHSEEDLVRWLPEAHEQRTGVHVDPSDLRTALDAAWAKDGGRP